MEIAIKEAFTKEEIRDYFDAGKVTVNDYRTDEKRVYLNFFSPNESIDEHLEGFELHAPIDDVYEYLEESGAEYPKREENGQITQLTGVIHAQRELVSNEELFWAVYYSPKSDLDRSIEELEGIKNDMFHAIKNLI